MTVTSFAIPITSQERKVAAKFQSDRPNSLAGEVEIRDGRTDGRMMRDDNTLSGIKIPDKLIINK